MGYVWDGIKWFGLALAIQLIVGWSIDDDLSVANPYAYWGIWVIALVLAASSWIQRQEKDARQQAIETHQYQIATGATPQEAHNAVGVEQTRSKWINTIRVCGLLLAIGLCVFSQTNSEEAGTNKSGKHEAQPYQLPKKKAKCDAGPTYLSVSQEVAQSPILGPSLGREHTSLELRLSTNRWETQTCAMLHNEEEVHYPLYIRNEAEFDLYTEQAKSGEISREPIEAPLPPAVPPGSNSEAIPIPPIPRDYLR